jgi:hypothetical protein
LHSPDGRKHADVDEGGMVGDDGATSLIERALPENLAPETLTQVLEVSAFGVTATAEAL